MLLSCCLSSDYSRSFDMLATSEKWSKDYHHPWQRDTEEEQLVFNARETRSLDKRPMRNYSNLDHLFSLQKAQRPSVFTQLKTAMSAKPHAVQNFLHRAVMAKRVVVTNDSKASRVKTACCCLSIPLSPLQIIGNTNANKPSCSAKLPASGSVGTRMLVDSKIGGVLLLP